MATDLENLIAARSSLIAQKADIAAAGPKPSYSVDGQQVNWMEYMQYLSKEIAELTRQIETDDGPVELVTRTCD